MLGFDTKGSLFLTLADECEWPQKTLISFIYECATLDCALFYEREPLRVVHRQASAEEARATGCASGWGGGDALVLPALWLDVSLGAVIGFFSAEPTTFALSVFEIIQTGLVRGWLAGGKQNDRVPVA